MPLPESRATRLLHIAVLGLAVSPAALAAPQDAPAESTPDYRALARDFARQSARLQEFIDDLPRETFDTKAVVEAFGPDPVALVEWVATETRWVPYRGCLRGAKGVLMDRRGSSLDRSLLVFELLELAGHEPSLHRGRLAPEAAGAAFDALRERGPSGYDAGLAASPDEAAIAAAAKRTGMNASALRADVLARQSAGQKSAEQGLARTLAQSKALGGFVDVERAEAGRDAEERDARAILEDHWWVEAEVDGAVVRFDPLASILETAGAEQPESSSSWTRETLAELPAGLHHELHVAIELERIVADGFERVVVTKRTMRPSEFIGKNVKVSCLPLGFANPERADDEEERARRMRKALLDVDEWLPMIAVGDDADWSNSFRADGTLNPKPQIGFGKKIDKAVSALSGLGAPADLVPGEAVALFVVWKTTRPGPGGTMVEVAERTVFDLIGDPHRRALRMGTASAVIPRLGVDGRLERALVAGYSSDAAPLVCRPSEVYVHGLSYATQLENRPAMIAMLTAAAEKDAAAGSVKTEKAIGRTRVRPVVQYAWGQLRTLYSGLDDVVFVDRINVVSRIQILRAIPGENTPRMRAATGYDICFNGVGVAWTPSEAPIDAARLRLRQGVADTVLEATLFELEGRDRAEIRNASVAFAASSEDWARVAAVDPSAPSNVVADAELGLLVGPSTRSSDPASHCYWRIDPETGATLGLGPEGCGEGTEYKIVLITIGVGIAILLFCEARQNYYPDTAGARTEQCRRFGFCAIIGGAAAVALMNPAAIAPTSVACMAVTS